MILISTPAARRRRIPLTPLIDVIFILIMFFLLSSTFGVWRPLDVTVARPDRSSAEARPADAPASVLITLRTTVDRGGTIAVNGRSVPLEELRAELDRLAAKGARSALLVPDSATEFQRVVTILDEARASRLARVGLHLD